MKAIKKLSAVLLVLVIMACLCVSAFAEGTVPEKITANVGSVENGYITVSGLSEASYASEVDVYCENIGSSIKASRPITIRVESVDYDEAGMINKINASKITVQWVPYINSEVNGVVWGIPMMILIVGAGVFVTIRTKAIQFGKFGYAMKNTIGKIFQKQEKANKGEMTPFQAMTTALAATVGTGNIAGVTGAIALGGPGDFKDPVFLVFRTHERAAAVRVDGFGRSARLALGPHDSGAVVLQRPWWKPRWARCSFRRCCSSCCRSSASVNGSSTASRCRCARRLPPVSACSWR